MLQTLNFIKKIQIPLPPLEIQQVIISQLDSYQKIIDGAKQVVDNYKPEIKINPYWEMVELGKAPLEIIDGDRGVNYPSKEDFTDTGYCFFLNTSNVRSDGFNFDKKMFISKDKDEALRKGKLKRVSDVDKNFVGLKEKYSKPKEYYIKFYEIFAKSIRMLDDYILVVEKVKNN